MTGEGQPRNIQEQSIAPEALYPVSGDAGVQTVFEDARGEYSLDARYQIAGQPKMLHCKYVFADQLSHVALNCDMETALDLAFKEHDENDTPRYFETALRIAYGEPELSLRHMLAGYDTIAGKPFHIFGIESAGETSGMAQAARTEAAVQPLAKRVVDKLLRKE